MKGKITGSFESLKDIMFGIRDDFEIVSVTSDPEMQTFVVEIAGDGVPSETVWVDYTKEFFGDRHAGPTLMTPEQFKEKYKIKE